MVRPVSMVWNHFTTESRFGKKTAKCKYCQKKYLVPNATKMAKHLEKCVTKKLSVVSVPVYSNPNDVDNPSVIVESQEINVENTYVDPDSSETLNSSFSSTVGVASGVNTNCSQLELPHKPILRFFDSVSNIEAENLNSAFAKAVYSLNLPLSLTDNWYLQNFFKEIRPSYKLPSRHALTNKLLDKEYENISDFVQKQIGAADFVTIVTDGWSNIRNEGIVCFIITTPIPIFYKSVETKENRHTAEYIACELIKVINEIDSQKVTALVTDNASNMKAAWKLVQVQYPHIFTPGCVAHGLNLLLGDIYKIGTFQMIIFKAKEVVKYVKNKQALLSVFTSKQKQKKGSAASALKLPGETRWCSTIIMFESLLNGKESLQEAVLIEELNIEKEIRQLVLDNDIFWASIQSLVNVLRPICDGITRIESDSATLSDVPHVFVCIKRSLASLISTPLQMEEEEAVKTVVETRHAIFCQPIHYATYILDPRYADENGLDTNDFMSAVDFITNFPSNEPVKILADFAKFQSRQSIYSNCYVWESAKLVTPLVWWRGFFKGQCLSSIALRLFSIPPSTASCERVFSAFSNTHTLMRNRLSNEKVAKLVSIRSNLILKLKQLSVDGTVENEDE